MTTKELQALLIELARQEAAQPDVAKSLEELASLFDGRPNTAVNTFLTQIRRKRGLKLVASPAT